MPNQFNTRSQCTTAHTSSSAQIRTTHFMSTLALQLIRLRFSQSAHPTPFHYSRSGQDTATRLIPRSHCTAHHQTPLLAFATQQVNPRRHLNSLHYKSRQYSQVTTEHVNSRRQTTSPHISTPAQSKTTLAVRAQHSMPTLVVVPIRSRSPLAVNPELGPPLHSSHTTSRHSNSTSSLAVVSIHSIPFLAVTPLHVISPLGVTAVHVNSRRQSSFVISSSVYRPYPRPRSAPMPCVPPYSNTVRSRSSLITSSASMRRTNSRRGAFT